MLSLFCMADFFNPPLYANFISVTMKLERHNIHYKK